MIKRCFVLILLTFTISLCSCGSVSKVTNTDPIKSGIKTETSDTGTKTSATNSNTAVSQPTATNSKTSVSQPTAANSNTSVSQPTATINNIAAAVNLAKGKKAEAFKSADGHEPKASIDSDANTYWESNGAMIWTVDLGSETQINAIKVKYSGNITAWSVQYLNKDLNKFIDIPGAVKNWQKNADKPVELTFKVLPVKTTKLQFNVYLGNGPLKLYDFSLYNIKNQDPVDSRNSYITLRHNRLLSEIALGEKGVFDVFPASKYKANNNGKWTTDIITDNSKSIFQ